jgi:hypothetical protein
VASDRQLYFKSSGRALDTSMHDYVRTQRTQACRDSLLVVRIVPCATFGAPPRLVIQPLAPHLVQPYVWSTPRLVQPLAPHLVQPHVGTTLHLVYPTFGTDPCATFGTTLRLVYPTSGNTDPCATFGTTPRWNNPTFGITHVQYSPLRHIWYNPTFGIPHVW